MATPPFKVKAVFDYSSPHEDDLNFQQKDIITVTAEEDDDWYYGEYTDTSGAKKEGIFPKNFVERIVEVPQRPARTGARKKTSEVVVTTPAPEASQPEPEPDTKPVPPAAEPAKTEPSPPAPQVASASPAPVPEREQAASPPKIPVPSLDELSKPKAATAVPKPQPAPAKAPVSSPPAKVKSPPPPVAEKSENVTTSFKDRLALFNKAAAPPVAPFNPGKPPVNFAKKPWVPPPPSKNSFVPPPNPYQNAPKPKRDEETPVPLEVASPEPKNDESKEEEPVKVMSLKDRMALLQNQQLDPSGAPKAKPRPPKPKRVESDRSIHAPPPPVPSAPVPEAEQEKTVPEDKEEAAEEKREEVVATKTKPKKSVEIRRTSEDGDYSAGDADLSSAAEPPRPRNKVQPTPLRGTDREDEGDDEGANDGTPSAESAEDEEDEEEVDPEVARRLAIMARMAKVSGGMGMHGVLNPAIGRGGMPPPPPKKKSTSDDKPRDEDEEQHHAAPVPLFPGMALPGMSRPKQPVVEKDESDDEREPAGVSNVIHQEPDEVVDIEDVAEPPRSRTRERAPSPESLYEVKRTESNTTETGSAPPPAPSERPAPPPPSSEGRPANLPPPPPTDSPDDSPSEGSATDDELSTANTVPPPNHPEPSKRPDTASIKRTSYYSSETTVASPPPMTKRASYIAKGGVIPPVPTGVVSPPASRAPPPPPPATQPPVPRASFQKSDSSEEEITEYEADYDTDMANKVAHRDALRPHGKSLPSKPVEDDDDETPLPSPTHEAPSPPRFVPPPPPVAAPPSAPSPAARPRQSMDQHRPPPSQLQQYYEEEEDNDNYFGSSPAPSHQAPPLQPPPQGSAPEARRTGTGTSSRTSMDIQRPMPSGRRSVDQARPMIQNDFIAKDVDLSNYSQWWRTPNQLPPVLQERKKDLHFEVDETAHDSADGTVTIDRNYYVVFHDYSQTVLNVKFNRADPSQAHLSQRHEAPPPQPRQDQLEDAHTQFGIKFYEGANSRLSTVVRDGDPLALISELFSITPEALPPAGTRAFGALVYANLANASVQQHDEIRPGDIVTFRHARFQGHKGGLHQKYSAEVGKPEHFAVVVDWDGTKKKLRAFEQGREKGKVKIEAFRIGDLRSGEVKVWRVMGRKWVGWDA